MQGDNNPSTSDTEERPFVVTTYQIIPRGAAETLLSEVGKKLDWLWSNSQKRDKAAVIFGVGSFLACTQLFSNFWGALGCGVVAACLVWFSPILTKY
jgi:hypothetical protein